LSFGLGGGDAHTDIKVTEYNVGGGHGGHTDFSLGGGGHTDYSLGGGHTDYKIGGGHNDYKVGSHSEIPGGHIDVRVDEKKGGWGLGNAFSSITGGIKDTVHAGVHAVGDIVRKDSSDSESSGHGRSKSHLVGVKVL